jgi:hypothetical protein
MIDYIDIPTEYKEYNTVNLCSNELENIKYLFGINSFPPIIIGKGQDAPVSWLYIRNNDIWTEIINSNKSKDIALQVFAHDRKLLIQFDSINILDSYEDENGKLIIEKINLKPLGLNIEGNEKGLEIAGNVIAKNTVIGGKFFVGLGS